MKRSEGRKLHNPATIRELVKHILQLLPIQSALPSDEQCAGEHLVGLAHDVTKAMLTFQHEPSNTTKHNFALQAVEFLEQLGLSYKVVGPLGRFENSRYSTNAELALHHGLRTAPQIRKAVWSFSAGRAIRITPGGTSSCRSRVGIFLSTTNGGAGKYDATCSDRKQ